MAWQLRLRIQLENHVAQRFSEYVQHACTESQIWRQMYGRAGVELLRTGLMPLPAEPIVLHRERVRAFEDEGEPPSTH